LSAFPTIVLIGSPISIFLIFILMILVIIIQRQINIFKFLVGFLVLLFVSYLSHVLGSNATFKNYGLRYAVWSLFIGLSISNIYSIFFSSDRKPTEYLLSGSKGNFFIKIGLVLMGVEDIKILLKMGLPGLFATWIPTPLLIIIGCLMGFYLFKLRKDFTLILVCAICICGGFIFLIIS
jgi:hypothetical protein